LALTFDVVESIGVILEQRGEKLEALNVEVVDVLSHVWAEQVGVDQVTSIGSDGEVLPAVVVGVLGMLLNHNDVFDPDTELSIVVVARLIGDTHAFDELLWASST